MTYKKSKLIQVYLLRNNPFTVNAVPATVRYSQSTLLWFLRKYHMVYLKPDAGGQGRGIIRITRKSVREFVVQYPGKRIVATSENQLRKVLKGIMRPSTYVIQRGIRSITATELPFDIRVHVQRLKGKWIVGGMVGKVGKYGEIVTNRHRGAKPVSIDYLLQTHLRMDQKRVQQVRRNLTRLSIETAKAMSKGYPYRQEYGIDIGMDMNSKLWIYEANITPGIHIFKDLRGQLAYQRILRNRQLRKRA